MTLFLRFRTALTRYGRRFMLRCGHRVLTVLVARKVAWGQFQPRQVRWQRHAQGWVLYVDVQPVLHLRVLYQRDQPIKHEARTQSRQWRTPPPAEAEAVEKEAT